jgi:hypothetical protein
MAMRPYTSTLHHNNRRSRPAPCTKKLQKRTQEILWNQQIDAKMGQNEANRLAVSGCRWTGAGRQFGSAPRDNSIREGPSILALQHYAPWSFC